MPSRHSTFRCLYKTLGLSKTASKTDIRNAYHRLAKVYHPDSGGELGNAAKFSQISDAYRVLSDLTLFASYPHSHLCDNNNTNITAQLKQRYDLKQAFIVGDEHVDLSDVGIGEKKTPAQDTWDIEQWKQFQRERDEEQKNRTTKEFPLATYLTIIGLLGFSAAGVYVWRKVIEAREKQKNLESYYNNQYATDKESMSKTEAKQSLIPSRFKKFKIIEREQLTPDSFRIRVALDNPEAISGLGITSCVLIRDYVGVNQQLTRAYTPTSEPGQKGYMDIVIKQAGRLSKALSRKKVGDKIQIKGPIRKFYYGGNGSLSTVSMIAGGSGITPHYQLMRVILNDPNDNTPIRLLYASKSSDNIILKKELDELAQKHPDQLTITYVVDQLGDEHTPDQWEKEGHVVGRINEDIVRDRIHGPGDTQSKVFICGPGSLIETLIGSFINYDLYNIYHKSQSQNTRGISGMLGKMGYCPSTVYEF